MRGCTDRARTAISMILSFFGSSPVISRSIQTIGPSSLVSGRFAARIGNELCAGAGAGASDASSSPAFVDDIRRVFVFAEC